MFEQNINVKNFDNPISIFINRLLLLINKIDFYEDQIKDYYLSIIKNIKKIKQF